jgi:hypothetical protein
MRGKLAIFFVGLCMLAAYVAAPFVTAWSVREAVRTGDDAYLKAKIDWPRVKGTLKESMAVYALGPPADAERSAGVQIASAPRTGLWQRIKNAYGRRVVASMVDNMATPAGLSRLFTYRKAFNENVRGIPDERETYSLLERIQRSWKRVVRAEFLTPTRFAMEMRDKVVAHRSYAGILELEGLEWRLVHLEVKRNRGDGLDLDVPPQASRAGSATSAIPNGLWGRLKQAALPR